MFIYFLRFLKLVFGLFLYGLGVVIVMHANIGYAPWEVLHSGISQTMGISIGVVTVGVGVIIVALTFLLGEKVGLGTLLNMLLIGLFMDLIISFNIIPIVDHLSIGIPMLILGLLTIAFASYFYISSAFGAGPRDSLMVAVTKKTGFPVGLCRGILEVSVVIVGYFLGGLVGIGTVISAFCIGFCIQIIFKLFKFDPTQLEHETLGMMVQNLRALKKNA